MKKIIPIIKGEEKEIFSFYVDDDVTLEEIDWYIEEDD